MNGKVSGEGSDKIDRDTKNEVDIENIPLSFDSGLKTPNGVFIAGNGEDGNASGEGSDEIHWDTEDELDIENIPLSSSSFLKTTNGVFIAGNGEASSSAGPSHSKLIHHFVGMGFSEKLVAKAIKENGEGNMELILETLLTYSALENPLEQQQCINSDQAPEESPQLQQCISSDQSSSEYDEIFLDDLSDTDSWSGSEIAENSLSGWEKTVTFLANMGYTEEEAAIAIDRCGQEASILELTDFICATQLAKAADANLKEQPSKIKPLQNHKKRTYGLLKKKKPRDCADIMTEDNDTIRLPIPMVGFGIPGEPCQMISRRLPEAATGAPYFYYENVAQAPKGVWDTMCRFLYDIEPEFVDSKYFSASARKRGYIHNLPINNRFPILPLAPRTIHEALPMTKKWWPSWDPRTNLNCLKTVYATAKPQERIRKAMENWDCEPPLHVKKNVIYECRKWNLVWLGRNKVAPLEPDEVEMLLGFPRNHTRGGGISRNDRYKSLGNSFQVDTVAYHLSVLKEIFPGGINLLSLFSGIGGAEVALYRLGIPLKNVVSVEISEVNRNIMRSWWEQTNQKGNIIHIVDIQQLNRPRLEQLMSSFGGFDLIVGRSPCNNLSGNNRVSRVGLEGKESALFYDYFRILDLVKCIMSKQQ